MLELVIKYVVPAAITVVVPYLINLMSKDAAKRKAQGQESLFYTIEAKAAAVVAAVEQSLRPTIKELTSDGKVTKEDGLALAAAALKQLLAIAAPEITALKKLGMTEEQINTLGSTLIEKAVYESEATRVVTAEQVEKLKTLPFAKPFVHDLIGGPSSEK